MKKCMLFILIILAISQIEARDNVVLTVPKAGTHYLKKIIENITNCNTMEPTVPGWYHEAYNKYCQDERTIVMGHCEPLILNILPQKEDILLLIRDPRDIALSAIDYIDKWGVVVWAGLPNIISSQQWNLLSKKEKLSLILNDFYDDRRVSIVTLFETAVYLTQSKNCFVLKYESLSPMHNSQETLVKTIQACGLFFDTPLNDVQAKRVIENSFRNPASATLIQGRAFRYLDEEEEIVKLLESKLSNYIDYFHYES